MPSRSKSDPFVFLPGAVYNRSAFTSADGLSESQLNRIEREKGLKPKWRKRGQRCWITGEDAAAFVIAASEPTA